MGNAAATEASTVSGILGVGPGSTTVQAVVTSALMTSAIVTRDFNQLHLFTRKFH